MNSGLKTDHAKISHTAVMCAKSFAENSDISYAKEIWQRLREYDADMVRGGNTFLSKVFRKVIMNLPSLRCLKSILEGRYVAINHALEEEDSPHVIELASGFSPRGLYFTRKDPYQIYIETDLPELQKIKKDIVEQIRRNESLEGLVATPNYHLIALNILDRKEFVAALNPYAQSAKNKPLAIVHAGLWPYLNRDEQTVARDNIAEVLRAHSSGGMWITPDIALNIKEYMANPLFRWRIQRLEKKTGRKFTFFETEEEAEAFLADGGFKTKVKPSAYLADSLTCVKNLGLNVAKVRQMSHMYDIYIMKLI